MTAKRETQSFCEALVPGTKVRCGRYSGHIKGGHRPTLSDPVKAATRKEKRMAWEAKKAEAQKETA